MKILKCLLESIYAIQSDQPHNINNDELSKYLNTNPSNAKISIENFHGLPKDHQIDKLLSVFISTLDSLDSKTASTFLKICNELSSIESTIDYEGVGKLYQLFSKNDSPQTADIKNIIRNHSKTIANEKLHFKVLHQGNSYISNSNQPDIIFKMPVNEKITFNRAYSSNVVKKIFSQVESSLVITIEGNEATFQQEYPHGVLENSMNEMFLYQITSWHLSAGDYFHITEGLQIHILEANEHVVRFKASGSDYDYQYGYTTIVEENEDFSIGSHLNNKILITTMAKSQIDIAKSHNKWLIKNNYASRPIYIAMLSSDRPKQHKFKLMSKERCQIQIKEAVFQFEIQ